MQKSGASSEAKAAFAERYRLASRSENGRILDELCAVTGWHRKYAVRALAAQTTDPTAKPSQRTPTYGAAIKDALVALWEAFDRICGKRLKVTIPTLLLSLERHGRLDLDKTERCQLLAVSAATIDRLLIGTNSAAAGGKRRRVGFHSAVRREVPIRTFNYSNDPAPGFSEVDNKMLLDENIRAKAAERFAFVAAAIATAYVMGRPLQDAVRLAYGQGTFERLLAEGCAVCVAAGYAPKQLNVKDYARAFGMIGRPVQVPSRIGDDGRAGDEAGFLLGEMVALARSARVRAPTFEAAWKRLTLPEQIDATATVKSDVAPAG